MTPLKYPNLFKPIRLGSVLYRNRIFASPTGYLDLERAGLGKDTLPPAAADYYGRKAAGGAAAVCVGECMVDADGSFTPDRSFADNPSSLYAYSRTAEAIRRYGSIPSAELNHSGMYSNAYLDPSVPAYGPVDAELNGRQIIAMDEAKIEDTIRKFADAAAFVKRAGFGMILIHAGHGWLIHQFLSPSLNTRKDKWGGASVENRSRFAVSICDAIRKAVGPGFPIEIRISGSEVFDGGYSVDEGVAFSKQLESHVDMIHVSAGHHEVMDVFTVTHPSLFLPDGVNVQYAAEIKKHVSVPVATVGALGDPEMMEEIIATGQADVVEMARAFIADPDFPKKARLGEKEEINRCMRCLSCFSALALKGNFYCATNPKAGRETEMKTLPLPAAKKKVLVAGGGIAGMQSALTAAERGHDVILCEKGERLGGVLLCEEKVPFKQLLKEYLDKQAKRIADAGVEIRLNTEVTPSLVDEIGADAVIAALGAKPIVPKIPGIDLPHVLSAEYAYVNPDKVGDRTVILGGGLVGVELGIYLSMLGKKVTIVEMLDQLNVGENIIHGFGLMPQIKKHDIDLYLSLKAEEILSDVVRCVPCPSNDESIETSGEAREIEADTVIYAVGQSPLQDEGAALGENAPEFYQIGDCFLPRSIMAATSAGFETARNIGKLV